MSGRKKCISEHRNHARFPAMSITLTQRQQEWLETHVERGEFASVEEAVRLFVEESIAERGAIESDDMAWAEPYLDEAERDIAEGRVSSLDRHLSELRARYGHSDR
jgi:Arc/MetJ-type ribon-helix-helix transcriptional regulator